MSNGSLNPDFSATDTSLPGGQGGAFEPTAGQTSDTRLQERAIRERWPIKDEYREAIVKRLVAVVVDPQASRRERTAACRALIAAESQNQSDEHLEIKIAQPQANVDVNVNVNGDSEGGIEVLMVPTHQLVSIPTLAEALAVLDEMGFVQLTDSGAGMMDIQRKTLDTSGTASELDPDAER